MTMPHTPTPWRAGDGGSILATWPDGTELQIAAMFHTTWSGNDGGKTRRIQDETPGNRAFIVRAANNHEALLAALQRLITALAQVNLPKRPSPEQEAAQRTLGAAATRAYAAIQTATGGIHV